MRHCPKKKPAFSSGLWLVTMQSGLFAEHRWPAFERFVISSFPTGIIRPDADEGINVKVQICSVSEQNADSISVLCWFDFNSLNSLASGLGEV